MAGKANFRRQMAGLAKELRRQVQLQGSGLDPGPEAREARIAAATAADGFQAFVGTYFPHYTKKAPSALHRYLFARLPAVLAAPESCREVIAAPRGEAKSTLCSVLFVLWTIVTGRKHYMLIIADASHQAEMFLDAIKAELEDNEGLRADFPDLAGPGRVWQTSVILTRNDIKIQALGSGKRLRGLRHGPHRPDLVMLDDIENDENIRRVEQRDKTEGWIDKAVMALGEAGGKFDVIYVGTVLHYDGVLARKLRHPAWRAQRFQALIRPPDRMDLWEHWEEIYRNDGYEAALVFQQGHTAEMLAGAEVSWPDARPLPVLMLIRFTVGHAAFDAEYQNDPINSEEALFGAITFWVAPARSWVMFGAVDPSLGKANKARDPSAILVGGIDRETGVLDVVEARIQRRLPDRIIEDVIALQQQYGCVRWAVEAIQFQEFFASELVKRSGARGIPVPVVPVVPGTDKALRIETLQPHIANGLIRLHPRLTVLLDQLRHYPLADHDDGPDALEMLWRIALAGRGGKILTGGIDGGGASLRRILGDAGGNSICGFVRSAFGCGGRRRL